MKPDWKDAPEWAQWLAMDSCGTWFWHELEPVITDCGNGKAWISAGEWEIAEPWFHQWKQTLEHRP